MTFHDMEVVMMQNPKRLSRRQNARILISVLLLVWATQTLLKQWGFGAEVPITADVQPAAPSEQFVPTAIGGGAMVELRPEATVVGAEVKLKQICRWSNRDDSLLAPIGDLVLVRLGAGAPFKSITIPDIRSVLSDAGVNVAALNFTGATTCTVSRSDVQYDEKTALQQWIDAKQNDTPLPQLANQVPAAPATAPTATDSPVKTLRDALIADIALHAQLPADALQIAFRKQDEKVLNISEPLFHYDIESISSRKLGRVMWNVSIDGGATTKRVTIEATARAWQTQLLAARPMAFRQVIRPDDVTEKRTLVDTLSDDPLLTKEQCVGQQASRELKPGTILTARMVDPVELIKVGQFVMITLDQGTVQVKTVAKALESGSFGQTIRVKNETTKDVFQVILTGPQTATMNLSTPAGPSAPVASINP